MTEIWMGYTSTTRAKKDEKWVITGNNQLARAVASWLTLSPYEVPSDIPERLATLLEQLVEPTDNQN